MNSSIGIELCYIRPMSDPIRKIFRELGMYEMETLQAGAYTEWEELNLLAGRVLRIVNLIDAAEECGEKVHGADGVAEHLGIAPKTVYDQINNAEAHFSVTRDEIFSGDVESVASAVRNSEYFQEVVQKVEDRLGDNPSVYDGKPRKRA